MRTGFSMEVLRAWERRYGFPTPIRRTGSNRRLYSQEDVERLVAIRHAIDHGYRIGDVLTKSIAELSQLAAPGGGGPRRDAAHNDGEASATDVARLVDLLARDELTQLEDALRQAALGPKRFVVDLAHPFATAVGQAWADGKISVRHEHVATEALITRLRHMLAAYQDMTARPLVLLATLPGEQHTLALQMVALYLCVCGAKPRLLGGPTPVADIMDAAGMLGANVVGLTVTPTSDRTEARRALRMLSKKLGPGVPIWVGGSGADALDLPIENARAVTTWSALDESIAQWRSLSR
jgi:DNA-binding transcriptional MerR regulator/methylmalonyl-CoA mutase cobalamin-binding subunit